jgi:ABC-2 type transport system permease protein
MKKIGIVTKREYLRRVNKKSFIFITLLAPVLFSALVFVPLWLSSIKSSDTYEVAVIDRTGKYASLFEDTDRFRFVGDAGHASADELKNSRPDIFAFLEITDNLLENPNAVTIYSDKQIPQDLKREVNRVLRQYLEKEKRASFNIPNIDEIIEKSRIHIDVQTIKWGKDGTESESSPEISSIIGMAFTLIIYMFIMMYGVMVMQSVMEEKTNRIVEVIVSSIRPFDLMMGKITGIGLVGITQVFIWCILTMILIGVGSVFLGIGGGHDMSTVQSGIQHSMAEISSSASIFSKLSSFNFVEIIIYFVLFFTGGYISYASLFAAVGSAIDTPEDSQQFMTPLMILLIFAVYAGTYSVNNPDGPLAFWCSLIPFTSPVVMMVRIPYEIPFWQILISLVLLFASDIFSVWLSAKIYRVGILMYGKKPGFKEIARWIKY